MAKLQLLELTNSSQIFGKSEYAMFTASTENGDIVEIGITYNSLERQQYDTDDLNSLVGCSIITKEFKDNQTGELVNPEDRLQMILDGDARLLLLNSINSRIKQSELYIIKQQEKNALVNAKVKSELKKEKKMQQLEASLERGRIKALAAIKTPEPEFSLDDEDETPELETSEKTADELGF